METTSTNSQNQTLANGFGRDQKNENPQGAGLQSESNDLLTAENTGTENADVEEKSFNLKEDEDDSIDRTNDAGEFEGDDEAEEDLEDEDVEDEDIVENGSDRR